MVLAEVEDYAWVEAMPLGFIRRVGHPLVI
jgi:hypothetical protein